MESRESCKDVKPKLEVVQNSVILCFIRGIKHGDTRSLVLFSSSINKLAFEIIHNGRHGGTLNPDFTELLIMLFADGIVLLPGIVIARKRS